MSGRKLVLLPYKILDSQDMSADATSLVTNIQYVDNTGLQLVWTGDNPIGTIDTQVSLDSQTWTTVSGVSVVPDGSAGSAYIDLNQLSAPLIRVIYTTAGGSVGNLTATIGAKMV